MIKEVLSTKVIAKYDVIVAGGGVAGASAAISAARDGKNVLLVDAGYILGGLATAGLITYYLPLCDGEGQQVSFGLNEELLRLSIKHYIEADNCPQWLGNGTVEERKKHRFMVRFNPQLFALELEKLLVSLNISILYGSRVCSVTKTENNVITHVIVENKTGRVAYECNAVVDATGDADICLQAGVPTANYQLKNILAAWYYSCNEDGYDLLTHGPSENPNNPFGEDEMLIPIRFTGIDAEENSKMVLESHKVMLNDVVERRKTDKSFVPVTIPTIPQLRMTRRIVGEYAMEESERGVYMLDSIGVLADWRFKGRVFEIPYGSIYNKNFPNLYVAGRCISVGETMWDVTRVIPGCVITGEAAGLAAANYTGGTHTELLVIQDKLLKFGEKLHIN